MLITKFKNVGNQSQAHFFEDEPMLKSPTLRRNERKKLYVLKRESFT